MAQLSTQHPSFHTLTHQNDAALQHVPWLQAPVDLLQEIQCTQPTKLVE